VRALELAHRYLNRRERTTHELRQHLVSRRLETAAIDEAVDELTQTGYLDDARYARMFAEDKRELEQWGSARIRRSLVARGIERAVVEAALEAAEVAGAAEPAAAAAKPSQSSEFARALALLERRFPSPPHERRDRQRALGVLVRRGYELELAVDVLNAYSKEDA
jgi:regulatory protein